MNAESGRMIVCPHCASTNRIPVSRDAATARCGRCHEALFEGKPTPVDAAAFRKHVERNEIPVVVDFWATWCGPCRVMAPVFEKVSAELEPGVRFLKVDTDAEQALAAQYDIRSIPTMMLFRGGRLVAQQSGTMTEQLLRSWIGQHPA